jgi:signal transduction histidine kinase
MVTDVAEGWSARVAAAVTAAAVVLAVTGLWLTWANRGVVLPSAYEAGPGVVFFLGTLPFILAGGLLATRRPANVVGWILLAFGLVWQAYGVAGELRITAFAAGATAPWAAWLWDLLWLPGIALVPVLLLIFPEGRLPSSRWRSVTALLAVSIALYVAGVGLRPGPLSNTPIDNPLGIGALGGLTPLLLRLAEITFIGVTLLSLAAPVLRYRRAGQVQRYQLKWFLTAAVLVIVAWMVADLLQATGADGPFIATIRTAPLVGLPVATAVAVLRYRLYDIDVALNKGLLYTGLIGVVSAVYLAVVFGVGALIGGRDGVSVPLAVAATALAAVVFQPARHRLQTLANRAVYGQRASPYEVLAAFTQRMAGAYPTGAAPLAMAQTVVDGLRVAGCGVWLRVGRQLHLAGCWPPAGPADPVPVVRRDVPVAVPGADRTYPVHHDGELLGAIGVTTAPGVQLSDSEDRLLTDLAAAAWLVLDNAQLVSELRTSRQRLIAAQDTQRRRTERDLHDGAQQRLLELALTLRVAHEQAAEGGAEPAVGTIAAAELQLRAALGELRDLARGIHPAILTERGLVAALESLAQRAPLPVSVTAPGVDRLAAVVEATAYFVAAEAMANVIKHAGAATATIALTITGDRRLLLTVIDDGCGGADPSQPGLTGLVDRVGALDGTLEVLSPPAGGTQIRMEVPCA